MGAPLKAKHGLKEQPAKMFLQEHIVITEEAIQFCHDS